jgi:hypothetical protein
MTSAFRGWASALALTLTLLAAENMRAQATAAAEALFNQGRDAGVSCNPAGAIPSRMLRVTCP